MLRLLRPSPSEESSSRLIKVLATSICLADATLRSAVRCSRPTPNRSNISSVAVISEYGVSLIRFPIRVTLLSVWLAYFPDTMPRLKARHSNNYRDITTFFPTLSRKRGRPSATFPQRLSWGWVAILCSSQNFFDCADNIFYSHAVLIYQVPGVSGFSKSILKADKFLWHRRVLGQSFRHRASEPAHYLMLLNRHYRADFFGQTDNFFIIQRLDGMYVQNHRVFFFFF